MNVFVNQPKFSQNISQKNCFDALRFLFAFSVFVAHFGLTGNQVYFPISASMAVSGFFIISGFLITRSYFRSKNLGDYAQKRIRRIVPAYFLIVVLCAFLFSLISFLPVNEYFSSKEFYKYLVSNLLFLNFLQPTLPEVFTQNPLPYINGSLWTIKVELALYAFLPIIALFLRKKNQIIALLSIYALSFLFIQGMSFLAQSTDNQLFVILQRQFFGQIRFFISGAIILFYFDFIIYKNIKYFLPISLIVVLSSYFLESWLIDILYPILFAILIIWAAYFFKKLSILTKFGDFSYGFYLFHFPVIQSFIYLGWLKNNPILLFIACFSTVYLLSALSWHFLEKPILRRKYLKDTFNTPRP